MTRHRPSSLLTRLVTRHRAPEITAEIADDAHQVRRYISENLLLGKMCIEFAPSDKAFASIVSALRIAKLAAEAKSLPTLVRVIDGAEGPLQAILARHQAGAMRALNTELATLAAVCQVVLEELDRFDAPDLVLAYQLDRLYREAARQAQQPA